MMSLADLWRAKAWRPGAARDENGRRLVVRNGHHEPREVLTSAGAVEVTVPRINDKRTNPDIGERKRFSDGSRGPTARRLVGAGGGEQTLVRAERPPDPPGVAAPGCITVRQNCLWKGRSP